MPIAYYCLLVILILPFVPLYWVKGEKTYDNTNPRESYKSLTGRAARAIACHQNHLEGLLFFAVAFFTAVAFNAPGEIINTASLGFVCARIAYTVFYIQDKANARSLAWTGGLLFILALFLSPIVG